MCTGTRRRKGEGKVALEQGALAGGKTALLKRRKKRMRKTQCQRDQEGGIREKQVWKPAAQELGTGEDSFILRTGTAGAV